MRTAVPAPWGLFGMLALAAVAEAAVATSADRLAGYEGLGVRFASKAAANEASRCDVLALGDSVIKFGFDPATVERRLGLKAYNLAVPGTPPPLTYAVFRRALDAGAHPRAVVVGQMTLAGDPWAHVAQLGELVGLDECLGLARSCRDPALFGALIAARGLPSFRYRQSLKAVLIHRAGPDNSARDRLQTWANLRGAELPTPDGSFDGTMEPALEARMVSQPWRVEAVFERYFRRLTDLAGARGVAVVWIVAPIAPEAQARRDALGLDDLHTRNLHAIHARMPEVVVLDARHAAFRASDFLDPVHLNARGAAKLSAAVADVIAETLGGHEGPNWVELAAQR
jgi:hypothetical protein